MATGTVAALGCSSSSTSAPVSTDGGHDARTDAAETKDAHVSPKTDSSPPAVEAAKDAGCVRSGTCNACLASDPDHCGSCDVSCGAGGSCLEGECTRVLASGQGSAPNVVNDLLVDDTRVYWIPPASGPSNGAVLSVPKAGGAVVTIASSIALPEGLAQDTTSLYFISHNVGIERVPKTGGARTTLLSDGLIDGGVPEFWLLRANDDLFYVGGSAVGVYDLPLVDGGTPIAIAPNAGVLGAPGTGYNTLTADDGGLYYDTTAEIVALDLPGNAVRDMVDGSAPSAGERFGPTIAADATDLYFVSNVTTGGSVTSSLMKAPKAGGASVLLTSSSVSSTDGPIVVGASAVYWTHLTDASTMASTIMAVPIDGGAVRTVATGCYGSCPFAVDATSIYWPGGDGTIRSAALAP